MGERRLLRSDNIDIDRNIRIDCREAHSFQLHAHEYFELEIVLEGSGTHILNGTPYTIERGSVYLLSPSDFHEIRIDSPTMLWNISFDEALLPLSQIKEIFSKRICKVLTEAELKKADTAATLLRDEVMCNGAVKPLIEYIISVIIKSNIQDKALSPIDKAILYIETHFREAPTLADVASQACLSPVYFGNLFKKETGETYVTYLNRRRVLCAKLLLDGNLSVTEACFGSGFKSLSGFLFAFKRATGYSPKDYKKLSRNFHSSHTEKQ